MLISATVRLLGEKYPSVSMGGNHVCPNKGLHPITGTHEWALQLPSHVNGGGERCGGTSLLRTLPCQGWNKSWVLTARMGFRVRRLGFTPGTY